MLKCARHSWFHLLVIKLKVTNFLSDSSQLYLVDWTGEPEQRLWFCNYPLVIHLVAFFLWLIQLGMKKIDWFFFKELCTLFRFSLEDLKRFWLEFSPEFHKLITMTALSINLFCIFLHYSIWNDFFLIFSLPLFSSMEYHTRLDSLDFASLLSHNITTVDKIAQMELNGKWNRLPVQHLPHSFEKIFLFYFLL